MADAVLAPSDFGAFFEGVHEHEPFGWQRELLEQVAADPDGRWPSLLDLPTGAGKTAVLDIAVFLLALDSQRPATQWRAPRRIVLVVDRRVVVDQAADRATTIAGALYQSTDPTVRRVAAALRELRVGDGAPLHTASLRGGSAHDPGWALRPDVPTIITSTVDQVGSRLLFRGYGESDRITPVHAGLVGNDSLFLLDEVHLSQPFAQTLRAVTGYRAWAAHGEPPGRWQVVELSATPSSPHADRFPSGALDVDTDPVLARRVRASKPAVLLPVKQGKDDARAQEQLVRATATAVADLLEAEEMRSLGVILNRVASARQVAAVLRAELGDGLDVRLLTGRMRPLDRRRYLDDVVGRLTLGRERSPDVRRLVLVATQCIEAGADFDLDGLVTECASLDALRQRFGRVDRDGVLSAAGTPTRSVILGPSRLVAPGTDDPVYGTAAAATWNWLTRRPRVDMGIDALALPADDVLGTLVAQRPDAPILLPGHLDSWVQTSPAPTPDPDVAHWLHGLRDTQAEVSIVWRADVNVTLFKDGDAPALLELCPPSSLETMSVPLAAARAWLAETQAVPVADVEGAAIPGHDARRRPPRAAVAGREQPDRRSAGPAPGRHARRAEHLRRDIGRLLEPRQWRSGARRGNDCGLGAPWPRGTASCAAAVAGCGTGADTQRGRRRPRQGD